VELRRLAVLALLCGLAAVLSVALVRLVVEPVDLANGKRRTQSSVLPDCPIERGICTGAPTRIIFCTQQELRPWYQIDLGQLTDFSRLTVVNRSDMLPERAVPLVAQVSDDGKNWREVARQNDTFDTWRAALGKQRARFVKVYVDRETIFHLDAVRVHP
jgi:hypothetical protein